MMSLPISAEDAHMPYSHPRLRLLQAFLTALLPILSAPYADAREASLVGCARFDFETGTDDRQPPNVSFQIWYDVVFCSGSEREYLRALPGVSWVESSTRNFAADRSQMAQAPYARRVHKASGYPDLFFVPAAASPSLIGKVYWIRTAEGNLVKLRIKSFVPLRKERGVARDMAIEYVIFL